nr:Ig-like domain-containing protein [Kribbia dieselivorans]
MSSRLIGAVAVVVAGAVLVTGCTTGANEPVAAARPGASSASSTPTQPAARISVNVADGASAVPSTTRLKVTVADGRIDHVDVRTAEGETVPGTASGVAWTAEAGHLLTPSTTYTVTARASNPAGQATTTTSTFTTFTPAVDASYMLPYGGDTTYGTGIAPTVQFDSAVTSEKFRQEVERRVSVTTTPKQEGAWGWLDNRQLMWRPKEPFTPETKVTLTADLAGVQTGADKFVTTDRDTAFTIGRDRRSYVDISGHQMTVTEGGKTLRRIPVSNGRPTPKSETRTGTKVIIEKAADITMDSSTVGTPEGQPGYYKIDTKYNLRVTWTGEFLHSAPWSVGAQGVANVTNGCVNMSPEQAKWMFDTSLIGDIVTFTGSNRRMKPTDGLGVWEFSWAQWKQQSARAR